MQSSSTSVTNRGLPWALPVLLMPLLSCCGLVPEKHYEDGAVSPDQVTTFYVEFVTFNKFTGRLMPVSLDGNPKAFCTGHAGCRLAPGRHTFAYNYKWDSPDYSPKEFFTDIAPVLAFGWWGLLVPESLNSECDGSLEFDGGPRHRYNTVVAHEDATAPVAIHIVDGDSKTVVATGSCTPKPPPPAPPAAELDLAPPT